MPIGGTERGLRRKKEKRERARKAKEKARDDKKLGELLARAKLICAKHEIHSSMARELAHIGFDAELLVAAMERDLVGPNIRKWQIYGELQSIKSTILRSRFINLRNRVVQSKVSVSEALTWPGVKKEQQYKILVEYLDGLLDDGNLFGNDHAELIEGAWPPSELSVFVVDYEIEERKRRKQREDFLADALPQGKILDESLEPLISQMNEIKADPQTIESQSRYQEAQQFKRSTDTTEKVLKSIFQSRVLRYDDYLGFEDHVREHMFGQDLPQVEESDEYKRLAANRTNQVNSIAEIEKLWMPNMLNGDELAPVPDPTRGDADKSYLAHFMVLDFKTRKGSRVQQFYLWLFFGFLGFHRFEAGRFLSGIFMPILLGLVIWHGGPKIGETGLFLGALDQGQMDEGEIYFDEIVHLKSNANLRSGPSMESETLATLNADEEQYFQVLKSAKDAEWYEIRQIRSIFDGFSKEQSFVQDISSAAVSLIEHINAPDKELKPGFVFKNLIEVDADDPASWLYLFSSTEVFIILLFMWMTDGTLLAIGSRHLRPSAYKTVYL